MDKGRVTCPYWVGRSWCGYLEMPTTFEKVSGIPIGVIFQKIWGFRMRRKIYYLGS